MITKTDFPKLHQACDCLRRMAGLNTLPAYDKPAKLDKWHLVKANSELISFTEHGISTVCQQLSMYNASAPSLKGILQVIKQHVSNA